MFNTFYSHNQLRRFLIAFGSLFNTIQVRRSDITGKEIQRIVVPIEYAPKDKWLVRLEQDPALQKSVAITVPRMSYEMINITYDSTRKLNSLNTLRFPSAGHAQLARLWVGVPYTIGIDLNILSKSQADGTQIVEQILPYFSPDLTFRLLTIPELNNIDQIPLTLISVKELDNYDGSFNVRRSIIWTLTFDMKVNFYGAIRDQSHIQEVIVDIFNSPLADILDPPITMSTEDYQELITEDGTGHLMDEDTPDAYLTRGPVAEIDVVATNPDQDPNAPILSTTTITEFE